MYFPFVFVVHVVVVAVVVGIVIISAPLFVVLLYI